MHAQLNDSQIFFERLGKGQPMLVMQSKRIHAELPNAGLTIFEESGHFPFIEETDKFVTTVRNWIAKLD